MDGAPISFTTTAGTSGGGVANGDVPVAVDRPELTCITHAIAKPKSRAKTPASARLSDRFLGTDQLAMGAPVVPMRYSGRSPPPPDQNPT